MTTMTKLVILELISGVCGWIWILSGAAALYFAAMAIFSGSPWSRVFWAVGVSVVAKWLMKGFHDNKIRVAFIAERMARGVPEKIARQEWHDSYVGRRK